MINIAFLVSNIDPFIGGTERVTQSIAKNLENIGYNVYFIYTNANNNNILPNKKLKIISKDPPHEITNKIRNFSQEKNIKIIRPGYGLHPKYYNDIIGKSAKRNIKYGTPIHKEMLGLGKNV